MAKLDRLTGRQMYDILTEAGIDVDCCRRIVIDIPMYRNGVVTVYREDIDDIKGIAESIKNGEQIRVEETV